jgi:hypothetical protein
MRTLPYLKPYLFVNKTVKPSLIGPIADANSPYKKVNITTNEKSLDKIIPATARLIIIKLKITNFLSKLSLAFIMPHKGWNKMDNKGFNDRTIPTWAFGKANTSFR